MQIKKHSINKKLIAIIAVVVVLIVGAVIYYMLQPKTAAPNATATPRVGIDYGPATDDQIKAGEEIKKANVDSDSQTSSPTPSPDGTKSNVEVTITSPDSESGAMLSVRAFLDKLVSTGTCTLVLTRSGSQIITQTAGVQASANTTVCKGFDVPTSGMTKGVWTAKISFDNDSLRGSASKQITIQ